jgi:hypothetical protein
MKSGIELELKKLMAQDMTVFIEISKESKMDKLVMPIVILMAVFSYVSFISVILG